MKKVFYLCALAVAMCMAGCSKDYDDSALVGRVDKLENRVEVLEALCNEMNTDISSLQSVVNVLKENDCITKITPVVSGGKTVGYTLSFAKNPPITIKHGEKGEQGDKGETGQPGADGKPGKPGPDGKPGADGKPGQPGVDGYVPQIGVKKDADGIYYWTIDGEWLTDAKGNRVCAEGKHGTDGQPGLDGKPGQDGADGKPGLDGKPGQDGKDGITPKFKIENKMWFVSYDEGASWVEVGSALGPVPVEPDRVFQDVQITDKEIVLVTKNGNFSIPRYQAVEILLESSVQGIKAGAVVRIPYTLTHATAETSVSATSDGNFKVKMENQSLQGGTLVVTAPQVCMDGYINVLLSDGNGHTSVRVVKLFMAKVQ